MANVTVLGAGAWGTAFGQVLADAGNDVMMWAIEPEIVKAIQTEHRNPVRLPSVEKLPDNMKATGDRAKRLRMPTWSSWPSPRSTHAARSRNSKGSFQIPHSSSR